MNPTELQEIKSMLASHMEASQQRHDQSQKILSKLEIATFGDENMGVDGMVKRVVKLEKAEATRKQRDWIIFGAASVSGFSLGKIVTYIGNLFGH